MTPYLRGQAWLAARDGSEAAGQFRAILAHRGTDPFSIYHLFAHLGLARALALQGNAAAARTAYGEFFTLLAHADATLPVVEEARREYARLGPSRQE